MTDRSSDRLSQLDRREMLKIAAVGGGVAALPGWIAAAGAADKPASLAAAGMAPSFYRRRVGDLEVTALLDGEFALAMGDLYKMMPKSSAEAAEPLSARAFVAADQMRLPVLAYVVKSGTTVALIDTGAAGKFGPSLGKLTASLTAAGVKLGDVKAVLLTHLHMDHASGLIDEAGLAVFANAEVVLSQDESKFWMDDANRSKVAEEQRPTFDAARSALAPYAKRTRLIKGEAQALPGVTAVALPGHTPGHTGYRIAAGSEQLLVWGDVVHIPAWQFDKPDWSISFDIDQQQAAATRQLAFDMVASDNILVAGMHLPFPGFARVGRQGSTFRYLSAP